MSAARTTPPTGDTKEQILKLASDLLRARGFSAFSYGHIAEALGVKPAAVHYHFATKTDLGLALVERYRDRYRRWTSEADDQGLSARDKLAGYFRIAARFSDDGKKVCPGGILESELHALPPEMQESTRAMVDETWRWLTRVLDDGRSAGELSFAGEPADMAALIAASLQGALQAARVLGHAPLSGVLKQLHIALGLPPPADAAR
jgi:AcrR family transcriptional regulator